jgi:hypothetical protein
MKLEGAKSGAKKAVGRLWLAVAAMGGAVAAYLADPERGKARRRGAVDRVRVALDAAGDRTRRLQRVVTERLSGGSPQMTLLESASGEPMEATSQPPGDEVSQATAPQTGIAEVSSPSSEQAAPSTEGGTERGSSRKDAKSQQMGPKAEAKNADI